MQDNGEQNFWLSMPWIKSKRYCTKSVFTAEKQLIIGVCIQSAPHFRSLVHQKVFKTNSNDDDDDEDDDDA